MVAMLKALGGVSIRPGRSMGGLDVAPEAKAIMGIGDSHSGPVWKNVWHHGFPILAVRVKNGCSSRTNGRGMRPTAVE